MKVEWINNQFVFFPQTTFEYEGVLGKLSLAEGESTDPESINRMFTVSDEEILQQET